eukprot:RCo045249
MCTKEARGLVLGLEEIRLKLADNLLQPRVAAQLINAGKHLFKVLDHHLPGVRQRARGAHQPQGIALQRLLRSSLAEDFLQLLVILRAADVVDHGEAVLALCDVLAEVLVLSIFGGLKVHVVIPNLEVHCEVVHNRVQVNSPALWVVGAGLHQPHGEPEQSPGLHHDHALVLLLRGADEVVPPPDVLALPAVQPDQLVAKRLHSGRLPQRADVVEGQEVHQIGTVDGVRHPKDGVRHGNPAPELAVVLNVVHQQAGIVQLFNDALHLGHLVCTNVYPQVEGVNKHATNPFPRDREQMCIRLHKSKLAGGEGFGRGRQLPVGGNPLLAVIMLLLTHCNNAKIYTEQPCSLLGTHPTRETETKQRKND